MSYYTPVDFAGSGLNNSCTSGLTLTQLDQRYLEVAGGDKMLTYLDAGNFNVLNVLDPVANQDATTKNYVDNSLLSYTTTLTALFPVLTSNTSNSGGWIASASSEHDSGAYPA